MLISDHYENGVESIRPALTQEEANKSKEHDYSEQPTKGSIAGAPSNMQYPQSIARVNGTVSSY